MYIDKAIEYIKMAYADTDKAHDFQHAVRVYNNSKLIIQEYRDADKEVVFLASLLHDVVDKKLFNDESLLDEWFKQYPSEKELRIREAISEISYSKGKKATTIESMIVQDADRLDAIGAIGIARVFTYGGSKNRPIYSDMEASSLSHFEEKLFKLSNQMNTEAARKIADSRDNFMHEFVERISREISGEL